MARVGPKTIAERCRLGGSLRRSPNRSRWAPALKPPTPPCRGLELGLAGVFGSRWPVFMMALERRHPRLRWICQRPGTAVSTSRSEFCAVTMARLYPLGASDGLRKCSACDRLDPGLVNAYIFAHEWPARKPIDQSWWPGWNAMAGKAARAAPMTFTSIRRGRAASSFRGTERFRAGWRVP